MPDKLRDSITKYHEFECSNRTEKLYSYEQAKQRYDFAILLKLY